MKKQGREHESDEKKAAEGTGTRDRKKPRGFSQWDNPITLMPYCEDATNGYTMSDKVILYAGRPLCLL